MVTDPEKQLIAACPRCGARYRVDIAGLPAQGGRLRCAKCAAVFRVTPPAGTPSAVRPGAPAQPGVASGSERAADGPVVVVGDAELAAGKGMAQVLADWGCKPVLVHDGVEAILAVQRALPAAVVIDSDLPSMSGFQICELMKRNESLRRIPVVLVGAVRHQDRMRGTPEAGLAADAYLERPQLPEALRPTLRGLGVVLGGSPAAPATEPFPPEAPSPGAAASPAVPEFSTSSSGENVSAPASSAGASSPSLETADPDLAEAERLARIIISDIVLYNAEKFDAGIRSGDVLDLLAGELDEGRALFAQRVEAGVRELRDFLSEELVRVAKSRGMDA